MKKKSYLMVGIAAITGISMALSPVSTFAQEAIHESNEYSLSYEENLVEVEGGTLMGYQYDGIYTFLGIQYAQAERFEMPHKVDAWEGIKPALVYKEVSPTAYPETVGNEKFWTKAPLSMETQNETCQYLNIWSSDLNPEEPKAVMVFLHGGGYESGSATECIAQDLTQMSKFGDIVAVSLNHRLNVLGFFDISDFGEEYKYSGNAGIADIVAALQWIHDNIAQFGGDPDNVTIFGQSGGGGKVSTLLGTPSAQGLFSKAIMQSGGPSNYMQEDAKAAAKAAIDYLGVSTVEELKEVPYPQLLEAANAAGVSYEPCIDGDFYVGTFVDGHYTDLANDIPVIIGTTFGEFSSNGVPIVGEGGIADETGLLSEEEIMARIAEKYGDENAEAIAEEFLTAYPGHALQDVLWINPQAWDEEQYNNLGSALGPFALWFADPCMQAYAKSQTSTAPVYRYVFALDYPIFNGVTATHGAELSFCFHDVDLFKLQILNAPEAYELQDIVCRAWTNFAKTGDPSQEGLIWEPMTGDNGATMIFDKESEVRYFHDRELMTLISQTPPSSGESASEAAETAEEAENQN